MVFYNTRFACASREERCLENVGICRLDLPFAMKTCILVEIDLQVYICVPKALFMWPKGIHFFTFCDLLDGTRKSHGDAKIQVGTRTLHGSPRQLNYFDISLTNGRISFLVLTSM